MTTKICMLSARFWPYFPRYGTRHPLALAEALVESGYEVVVVTSFPKNIDGTTPKRYRGKLVTQEKLGEIEIIRVKVLPFNRIGLIRKLIFNLTFMVASLLAIPFIRGVDVIFGVDPDAPFLLIPGLVYSRLAHSRYLLLVTDLWPNVVFDYGVVTSSLLKKMLTMVTTLSYRLADRILTITDRLKEGLLQHNVPDDKIDIAELGVDTSVFHPIQLSKNDLIEMAFPHTEARFIVLYSGSLSIVYDFNNLLEAAALLEDNRDIVFIIRGHGEMKHHILSVISGRRLKNVFVRGVVPDIETVVKYINHASVCVVPLAGSSSEDITHPSKVFEFWACKKPTIVCSRGELANLVESTGSGIAVDVGDPKLLAEAIAYLYRHPEESEEMGMRGLVHVDRRYSKQVLRKKMGRLIGDMVKEGGE